MPVAVGDAGGLDLVLDSLTDLDERVTVHE